MRPEIAERGLGHAIPGIEGVYHHYPYGPEKAEALIRLSSLIDQIVNPSKAKVAQLDEHRRKKRKR